MKKRKTKQLILDKSFELFGKNSFFSISMQDIANHLNIQKSLLYYYFENKAKLFQEVIENNFTKINKQFDIIFNQNISADKKIEQLSKIYLQEIKQNNFLFLIKIEKGKIDNKIIKELNQIQNNIIKYFENTFKEGIKKGKFKSADPKTLSLALLGYLEKIQQHKLQPDKNWLDFLIK